MTMNETEQAEQVPDPLDEIDRIHDVADRVFRKILELPENLRAFLTEILKELAAGFDFEKAKLLPRDFLLEDWRGREADLLFEIPYRMADEERLALVCVLIEHQTKPDRRMPLRTLVYGVLYWEREWRRWQTRRPPRPEFELTPIVPIVLHASPHPWGSAKTLADIIGGPAPFRVFAPKWEPIFWELADRSSQELLNSREAFFQLLSVVRAEEDPAEEFEAVFRAAMQSLGRFHDTDRVLWHEMLSASLTWACNRRPIVEKPHWIEVAESAEADEQKRREIKRMGKTIAQGYREEGKIEGELEGIQKIVLRLGRSKFGDPDETIEQTIRSIDKVERLDVLADRILIANNWNELLKS